MSECRVSYTAPEWAREGADWPNREASRFVEAGGVTWHVQVMGQGPALLLIHGTGAASHSFRDLAPLLAERFTVIVPDMPGHGFSSWPAREDALSLPGMATALGQLLQTLGLAPKVAAGHSAGAAVLAQMQLHGHLTLDTLVSINGALLPLPGLPGIVFSPIAKVLNKGGFAARVFSLNAREPAAVERLLWGTGSCIDARGIELYARLIRFSRHTAAALGMMARWNLKRLQRDLPTLKGELVMIVGANDVSVPPTEAGRVAAHRPGTRLATVPCAGHLVHEEKPDVVADLIFEAAGLTDASSAA
ncbi:alpha/beta fold hydrolase BchO [Rhodovibrio salinarum]|uniref:Alpha/beta hydrolase n=1 Tax=Rhodovibrio salinarum TaxID=1087 RepID=A0A934UZF7_9PROT|nr:alpha/beta fold hydrolase BchO [Rhodovibrio salinarum]MBK1696359.1 alpha/beta hydrolase [Rhodovibrio salinarum]